MIFRCEKMEMIKKGNVFNDILVHAAWKVHIEKDDYSQQVQLRFGLFFVFFINVPVQYRQAIYWTDRGLLPGHNALLL